MEDLCQFYTLLFEANIYNIADVKQNLETILSRKNADPVIKQWFMNHYIKHLQKDLPDNDPAFQPHQLQPGDPEWAAKTVDFEAFTEQQEQEILHFIDYFQQLSDLDRSKINKEAYDIIDQKVKDWDTQLASKMDSEVKQNTEGVDYETVMAFPDGYKIVRILGDACRVEEGKLMGHCVGGENYADKNIIIYSLRDPSGYPHVTIQYSKKAIRQIKGKENKAPVAKYVPYIKKWIEDNNLAVRSDGENIGMIKWNNVYYFKDSKEFQQLYQTKILPLQKKTIQEIESKIVDGVYNGDLSIERLFLTELPDWSHLTVTGHFNCSNNQLTNLKGCPKIVKDGLYCYSNQLTSLKGCPKIVGGGFYCARNQLTSLEGCPENVGTFFNCDDNQLTSLKGCPEIINGDFICNDSQLTTLEGGPRIVGGTFNCSRNQLIDLNGSPAMAENFYCNQNQLTSLKGCTPEIRNIFECCYNQLTNLIGGPKMVGGRFDCTHNPLTSLEGKPKYIGGKFYHDPLPESNAAVMEHYIRCLQDEILMS